MSTSYALVYLCAVVLGDAHGHSLASYPWIGPSFGEELQRFWTESGLSVILNEEHEGLTATSSPMLTGR